MSQTLEELRAKLIRLGHAMQSGVAFTMLIDPKATSVKHLRVGVNNALINNAAIASLLMQQGIITEEEYLRELITWTEQDIERYREQLQAHDPGTKIDLA